MWVLVSLNDTERKHQLLCGREYTIGRKDCDIIVENDMSISRKHASVSVAHPEANVSNPQKLPLLSLEDSSRLGSLVGDRRITKERCVVNNGTVITLGTAGISKYRAEYEPYLVTTSCLDAGGKKETRKLIGRLGGHVISEWRKDCQILVMNTLSITIKAICALITQKAIVTPQYLSDCIKSIESGDATPTTDGYLPPLAESQLDPTKVSFKKDVRRQKVFEGRLFVFLSTKQFKKLSVAVELAGGTPMLTEEGSDDGDDMLIMPAACVMDCDLNDQSQNITKNGRDWIQHVMAVLQKHKKRPIQECEIGYAVLYCSIDKYCNPDVLDDVPGVPTAVPGQTLSQIDIPMSQLRAPATQNSEHSQMLTNVTRADNTPGRKNTLHLGGTNSKNKKRGRDSDNEAEEASAGPARKSAKSSAVALVADSMTESDFVGRGTPAARGGVGRVKEEPVTPRGKPTNNNYMKQSPVTGHRGRENTKNKSRSPSPVPDRRVSPRSRNTVDAAEPSTSRQQRTSTKQRNSPTPPASPSTRRRNTRQNSPSPDRKPAPKRGKKTEEWDSDFDDIAPVVIKEEPQSFTRSRRTSPDQALYSDPDDNINSDGEVDVFSMIPTRKRRSPRKTSPAPKSPSPSPRSRSPTPKVDNIKKNSSPAPKTDRGRKAASPKPKTKESPAHSPVAIDTGATETESYQRRVAKEEPNVSARMPNEVISRINDHRLFEDFDQAAFITTKRSTKVQGPVDDYCVYDKEQPLDVVVLEKKSLVARPAGQSRSKSSVSAPSNVWQGKVIKNFKKFKKVEHSGSHHLPTVIGGNDLFTHEDNGRQDRDKWFKECLENETQQSQEDQEAQDLFNFNSKTNVAGKAKGRAAGGRRR